MVVADMAMVIVIMVVGIVIVMVMIGIVVVFVIDHDRGKRSSDRDGGDQSDAAHQGAHDLDRDDLGVDDLADRLLRLGEKQEQR